MILNFYYDIPLREVVDDYLFFHTSSAWAKGLQNVNTKSCASMIEELNRILVDWLKNHNIEETLGNCVRQRVGHQRRMTSEVAKQATDILCSDKNITSSLLGDGIPFKDFEDLYDYINYLIGPISGIGNVAIYDTAKRIGHLLSIYPKMYVYISAGAEEGAKKLLGRDVKLREPISAFSPFFGTLPSIFIEDILCLYRNVIVSPPACFLPPFARSCYATGMIIK